ncbi:RNB-domain-containing protein [Teratosphaeria nubilosa]|uniref:RNB-domain-containing protein n=1 Tax=Teratosphaeria nubilosa TaxID=161662 RepID=A0A6G1L2P6_9PEZI|nr:RNB-domain-containing protein [Teratosphaeria nubilosa]
MGRKRKWDWERDAGGALAANSGEGPEPQSGKQTTCIKSASPGRKEQRSSPTGTGRTHHVNDGGALERSGLSPNETTEENGDGKSAEHVPGRAEMKEGTKARKTKGKSIMDDLDDETRAWMEERLREKERRRQEERDEWELHNLQSARPKSDKAMRMTDAQKELHPSRSKKPQTHLSQARRYHTAPHRRQQTAAAPQIADQLPPDAFSEWQESESPHGIRAQLRKWHELNGAKYQMNDEVQVDQATNVHDDLSNNMTRLPNEQGETAPTRAEMEEDHDEAVAYFMQSETSDDINGVDANLKSLNTGDLVEIERKRTGRESLVAIFVRSTGRLAQFYTINGRWIHLEEKRIMYSVPNWVPSELVTPLLNYLPAPEIVETRIDELMEDAAIMDLNVPRHVSAGLISKMAQFEEETREIYRKNASALDGAHELLAHDSDLRYGSLASAASTLLRTPISELPVTALFAVRRALSSAGFAFDVDPRSHRHTGYLQIRSKQQVKLINQVRGWMREWQDDVAYRASLSGEQLLKHRSSKAAKFVYSFIEKAKSIVQRSREDRESNNFGGIGPSKTQIPITPKQDAVRVRTQEVFTAEETDIVRFFEAWALHQMFVGIPTLAALSPLVLQATGLYDRQLSLALSTGFQFLQELGTITPYENRTRFDTQLLLPSSQHSKPLQNLMTSLLSMANKHNFQDSMKHLRRDWKGMPVYCIDSADAHEIDDGISIEETGRSTHGAVEWWVHIHIANPTAFFSRDHPLAKMARHMGETIYMPERTYMMLPRWCTQQHFSLAPDRPCLTFSTRVNEHGETLEHKITPGTIRNVFRLTHQEVADLLGATPEDSHPESILTIGGEAPPARQRHSRKPDVSQKQVQQLRWLVQLANKRVDIRRRAGGLFFDVDKPEVSVWQQYKSSGLAWDHPFRTGWRRVEGDPVIQMKTRGLQNWFLPSTDVVRSLVQESMLLACEIAANWCQERQVPAIFRGSVRSRNCIAPDTFHREYLAPSADPETGAYPMHLGTRYLETFGRIELRTRPITHKILGMDAYGKVTSPLRRYGDMIMHWQIEATLREEAAQNRSLVSEDPNVDRSFLPFSERVLQTIFVGLQPRESLINRAKQFADNHWTTQMLFRHIVFGQPLTVTNSGQANEELLSSLTPHTPLHQMQMEAGQVAHGNGTKLHAYIHTSAAYENKHMPVGALIKELNLSCEVHRPQEGEAMRLGDLWECEVAAVDAYKCRTVLRPVRLVERVDNDGSLRNLGRIA